MPDVKNELAKRAGNTGGGNVKLTKSMSIADMIKVLEPEIRRALPEIRPEDLKDFARLAGKVAFKLVNAESNRGFLQHVPHVPWLDLAVIFYLMLDESQYGHMTAVIHNSHMTAWGTSVEELYRLAERNTPELLPIEIRSMDDVMWEVLARHLGDECCEEMLKELLEEPGQVLGTSPLYVMSNTSGINGTSSMLAGGALKEFADSRKADLVILPSSVHEVLLIPREEGLDFTGIFQMVRDVNETEVPVVDRLSDQVYQYCRDTGQDCGRYEGS